MEESTNHLERIRTEIEESTTRAGALLAQVPEPAANMAEAMSRVFSPEQLAELWQNREEAMRMIAADVRELREELARFEKMSGALRENYMRSLSHGGSVEPHEHFKWFEAHAEQIAWLNGKDERIGQLKTTIHELDALYAEFEAHALAPAERAL